MEKYYQYQFSRLNIYQVPILKDNYVYIIQANNSKKVACVDPGRSIPVIQALDELNLEIDTILVTHHHWDHVEGILDLKNHYNCKVIAHIEDKDRIPGYTDTVTENDEFIYNNCPIKVIKADGHTIGHILYWLYEDKILFCGDTLFSMGCGRLFEGTYRQMKSSLEKIKNLPLDTNIFCTHEYTLTNSELAIKVEPENTQLTQRIKDAHECQNKFIPTVPMTLETELQTNPFLRTHSLEIKKNLNLPHSADDLDVFTLLRKMRNDL